MGFFLVHELVDRYIALLPGIVFPYGGVSDSNLTMTLVQCQVLSNGGRGHTFQAVIH
jgi:hypothetical protein